MVKRWMQGALVATLGTLLAAGGIAPASAAPVGIPIDVVVHTEIGPVASEFEGNIPGCPTGTVVDGASQVHGTPWGGIYAGVKEFTCDGGAGGFDVRLSARFGEFGSTGTWTIIDAWGVYEGVRGSGSLVGTITELGIDDRYIGTAR